MKNIIILIFSVFLVFDSCAQISIPPYKQLSLFSGDTLDYLTYNFETRKAFYSGKSMEILINDLEIPIRCVIPTFNTVNNDGLCDGLLVYFDDKYITELKLYNEITLFSLKVIFNPKLNLSEVDKFIQTNGGPNWNSALNEYFGKQILGELYAFANPEPDATVISFYDFIGELDHSQNGNNISLQEGAYLENSNLILTGGNPWDYLHPHATAANSPSLNPQYITVAGRFKVLYDFEGDGTGSILSKPIDHNYPVYQYNLGICGTYCGSQGHSFSFSCMVEPGQDHKIVSPPSKWIPNQWYTVIGTYDGSVMKLFVDGSLVASQPVSGVLSTMSTDLFIGTDGNAYQDGIYSIPVEIDWIKTYNRALSDLEVSALSGQ